MPRSGRGQAGRGRCLAAWALSAAASIPALVEHQALIVGVGDYAHGSVSDLPGIDLDVNMMRDAAQLLGFREGNIRTLLDRQGALAGFRREVQRLAENSYADDDRVLIYFNGHGTHVPDDNGDEPDEWDEMLMLHDILFVGPIGPIQL